MLRRLAPLPERSLLTGLFVTCVVMTFTCGAVQLLSCPGGKCATSCNSTTVCVSFVQQGPQGCWPQQCTNADYGCGCCRSGPGWYCDGLDWVEDDGFNITSADFIDGAPSHQGTVGAPTVFCQTDGRTYSSSLQCPSTGYYLAGRRCVNASGNGAKVKAAFTECVPTEFNISSCPTIAPCINGVLIGLEATLPCSAKWLRNYACVAALMNVGCSDADAVVACSATAPSTPAPTTVAPATPPPQPTCQRLPCSTHGGGTAYCNSIGCAICDGGTCSGFR